jgi:hypothetical protein
MGGKGKWGEGQVVWSPRAANSKGQQNEYYNFKKMVFYAQKFLNY